MGLFPAGFKLLREERVREGHRMLTYCFKNKSKTQVKLLKIITAVKDYLNLL